MNSGGLLDQPTTRQRYLREQSQARYLRRPDAYPIEDQTIRGEIGVIESFRIIVSESMPRDRMLVVPGGERKIEPDGSFVIFLHSL